MSTLQSYLFTGATSLTLASFGAEVETQFLVAEGMPISVEQSQRILSHLCVGRWSAVEHKGLLITRIVNPEGDAICYELGRHNLEVVVAPCQQREVLQRTHACLSQLYDAAQLFDAYPFHGAVFEGDCDVLVIPDERDVTWVALDGREALNLLARTSSVQFTISLDPRDALRVLNELGSHCETFVSGFPQDKLWRRYISSSHAQYRDDRYGGPLVFKSISAYCLELEKHDVVCGNQLKAFVQVDHPDLSLFVRSVWWHFRLKRYGDALCIEVRPIGRGEDDQIAEAFDRVCQIVEHAIS